MILSEPIIISAVAELKASASLEKLISREINYQDPTNAQEIIEENSEVLKENGE